MPLVVITLMRLYHILLIYGKNRVNGDIRFRKNKQHLVVVNGVPSFCAAAGALGISLADNKEEIHVIPGSYEIGKTAEFSGTRIYMKSGKKLGELKQMLQKQQKDSRLEVYSVENCGMMNEKITIEVEKLDDTSGYLTIVIVKEH